MNDYIISTTINSSIDQMEKNSQLADEIFDTLVSLKKKANALTICKISKRVERICDNYEYKNQK